MGFGQVKPPRNGEPPVKRILNLDMDGVLADFEGHYLQTFGVTADEHGSPKVSCMLADTPDFFDSCPVLPGAQEFFYMACTRTHLEVVILTSVPLSCIGVAAASKRRWIRKHFGGVSVIPVPGSGNKPHYLQNPASQHGAGDLLIDDWGRNCEGWREAGGYAIKHEGNWERTTQAFNEWLRSWGRNA